ncbi:MAG TPA: RDD family protein [Pyrinomonadaceae bacterium]|nr:RDD family protein [Pyrinomonadaceae bacterium]
MFEPLPAPAYAGFWIRFLAYFIDTLISCAVFFPVGIILGVIIVASGSDPNSADMILLRLSTNGLSIVAGWLYFSLCESSAWQGTVGKKVLGLRVTDLDGRRISFGRATGRHFSKILSGLILGIGFIMIAFSEKKQGLHDQIAGTLVLTGGPTGETLLQPPPPPDFRYGGGTLGLG